ncbi:MAG TPA: AEC family transporter [Bacteroidaceae bacterium]|nr:AEC family transporter [Bacteroidaceae bacterium]
MENQIILNQIIILAILVAVGVLATKLRVINESVKDGMAKLIFQITLPLFIITSMARIDLTAEIILNSGLVFLYAFLAFFIMFLTGTLFARLTGLQGKQRAVFINHHIFGNIVFLGFPLMDALFPGGEGLLYAAIFQLASNIIMWSFGVWIFIRSNGTPAGGLAKNMLNPNTIALLVGLVIMYFKFRIPDVIFEPLNGLGKTTIYLSMLYIGAMLSYMSIKGALKKFHIYLLSFNKLLFVPAILAFIIYGLSEWITPGFGPVARKVLVLESAMPCMAIIVVLAKRFNSDDALAAENVFFSTIASLFTLPLVYSGLIWIETWI